MIISRMATKADLTILDLKIKTECLDRLVSFKSILIGSDPRTRRKLKNTTPREGMLQPVERRWFTPKRSKLVETIFLN